MIRDPKPSDGPYLLKCWVTNSKTLAPRTFQNQSGAWRATDEHYRICLDGMRRVALQLLQRSVVKVACDDYDHDRIHGFAVARPDLDLMHFVYVRPSHQGSYLAARLVRASMKGKRPRVVTQAPDGYRLPRDMRYAPHYAGFLAMEAK